MIHETLQNAMRAGDTAKGTGLIGVSLATIGGLGWFKTENILWLIPIAGAAYYAAANAYYATKLIRAKAKIDLDAYRAKVAKDTGVDIKVADDL